MPEPCYWLTLPWRDVLSVTGGEALSQLVWCFWEIGQILIKSLHIIFNTQHSVWIKVWCCGGQSNKYVVKTICHSGHFSSKICKLVFVQDTTGDERFDLTAASYNVAPWIWLLNMKICQKFGCINMWPVISLVGLYLALGAAGAEFLLNPERFQGNVYSPNFCH